MGMLSDEVFFSPPSQCLCAENTNYQLGDQNFVRFFGFGL